MKTTMPTATISYNSEGYLVQKLNELLNAKIIQFWAYVRHKPEEDEKKPHAHLYIEPAKSIQTEDLREELREYVPENPDKPLGCLPFGKSKFADWYMYVCHDKIYLASKGQSRKYHYRRDDFVTSDEDYLEELIRNINLLAMTPYQLLNESIEHGDKFGDLIRRGQIPLQQLRNYMTAWQALAGFDVLNRNDRCNHETDDFGE